MSRTYRDYYVYRGHLDEPDRRFSRRSREKLQFRNEDWASDWDEPTRQGNISYIKRRGMYRCGHGFDNRHLNKILAKAAERPDTLERLRTYRRARHRGYRYARANSTAWNEIQAYNREDHNYEVLHTYHRWSRSPVHSETLAKLNVWWESRTEDQKRKLHQELSPIRFYVKTDHMKTDRVNVWPTRYMRETVYGVTQYQSVALELPFTMENIIAATYWSQYLVCGEDMKVFLTKRANRYEKYDYYTNYQSRNRKILEKHPRNAYFLSSETRTLIEKILASI